MESLALENNSLENNFVNRTECIWLAEQYYPHDEVVLMAAKNLSPEQFIRLFVTSHGMQPIGNWQTHTYARLTDSTTNKDHFFLIPMTKAVQNKNQPWIRFENNFLKIDHIQTNIYPQSIPYTTPFWYFHYDPNNEKHPFHSLTLNLSPACPEKCVLCAGAKTGRVNNGMETTLSAELVSERIFNQHPHAKEQLDSVAIVTGCFNNFNELKMHLIGVRQTINKFASPSTYRVLEHNISTNEQFEIIVGSLGYDVFITLECFDQEVRNIALNGKVGRKGRNSQEFLDMIRIYAQYLEARNDPQKRIVRVTYLVGLDSLSVMEYFFQQLFAINKMFKHAVVLPWLSIFTAYSKGMSTIQRQDFDLRFILEAIALCEKYFDPALLATSSGGTVDGYARGLF